MALHGYDEPVYVISVAAELLCMHPQTLRMYERENLVVPSRTESNNRMYSHRDLDEIREIRKLTREQGVNLAGVKIILELRRKIELLKNNNT
ncbi:MAG TPA: helix-turn-helix transcriptional regulator [bacterium]|nr:helix-turn-helix transcriptional regulator [bacterium]